MAVDEELEFAGRAGGFPVSDPVLGADENAVSAGFGEADGGGGVVDGLAEAMGEEVGRTHDVYELGVELPATLFFEGFGFDEEVSGPKRPGTEKGGEERERERSGKEQKRVAFHTVYSNDQSIPRRELTSSICEKEAGFRGVLKIAKIIACIRRVAG